MALNSEHYVKKNSSSFDQQVQQSQQAHHHNLQNQIYIIHLQEDMIGGSLYFEVELDWRLRVLSILVHSLIIAILNTCLLVVWNNPLSLCQHTFQCPVMMAWSDLYHRNSSSFFSNQRLQSHFYSDYFSLPLFALYYYPMGLMPLIDS